MRDRGERIAVMGIEDQPRHLVGLVRDERLLQKHREGQIGETQPRCHALLVALGSHPGKIVAGARRRGLGQQHLQVREGVGPHTDGLLVHGIRD